MEKLIIKAGKKLSAVIFQTGDDYGTTLVVDDDKVVEVGRTAKHFTSAVTSTIQELSDAVRIDEVDESTEG